MVFLPRTKIIKIINDLLQKCNNRRQEKAREELMSSKAP